MVAHRPGKTYSRRSLYETVLESSPIVRQIQTLVLIGICQFPIVVGGKAATVGKGDHYGYLHRRIGGIYQVQIEPVALAVLIDIGIVVNGRVIVIIGDVTLYAVALHQNV